MQNFRLQSKLTAVIVIPAGLLLLLGVIALFLGDGSTLTNVVGIVALLSSLACAVVGFVFVTPVLKALSTVTYEATDLAERRLPSMLRAEDSTFGFEPLTIAPTGEPDIDEIAGSLEKIHAHSASSFYEQQERVREGLAQVVANLARRNQSLLDRQVTLIDEMEETEQDPDRLDRLFRLDHMATHMKRNQESLLVLADAESKRRRGGREELEDVVQVAMGEIEEYRRISIQKMELASVSGSVAGDLAHLLAELLENACTFSSPETQVVVTGVTGKSGTYVLSVGDEGVGMSEEQLAVANKVLLEPPDLGLNMGRTLGFAVIGKLAERLEVEVTLVKNPNGGGITAIIEIPAASFSGANPEVADTTDPRSGQPEKPRVAQTNERVAAPIADPLAQFRQNSADGDFGDLLGSDQNKPEPAVAASSETATAEVDTWVPPTVTPRSPEKLIDAVPTGEKFDDGLEGLLDPQRPRTPPSAPTQRLSRREPGAATPKAERRKFEENANDSKPEPTAGRAKASARDPQEIRQMLSRYREGIKSNDPKDET